MTDVLLRLPVVKLVELVKTRALSPLDLVDTHIDAILKWNPIINAVVANRFEDARKEARLIGDALARGELRDAPLAGIPFTVKESFGVTGLPHTSGSTLRKGRLAEKNAPVVDRLVDAGGVILGVTNMPEMAMWMETDNLLYGRTNNPWDPSRTSGGSSGGEAAVVGAGASPFGVASDVGGSIRLPALFCGVVGHKSTGGLVTGEGHVPQPSSLAKDFVGIGPIARSALDLPLLVSVMCGHHARFGDPRAVDVRKLTVHVVHDDGRRTPSPAMRTAVARAARALEARGAHVVETELTELREAFDMWGDSLRATAERSFESWLGDDRPVDVARDLLRRLRPRGEDPRHHFAGLAFLALERAANRFHFTKGGYEKALQFKERLRALLGKDALLLAPAYTNTAPRHNESLVQPGHFVLSAIWNVLDVAATEIPVGKDGRGLPAGVQLIGARDNDAATIAAAIAVEEELGGWMPPSLPRA